MFLTYIKGIWCGYNIYKKCWKLHLYSTRFEKTANCATNVPFHFLSIEDTGIPGEIVKLLFSVWVSSEGNSMEFFFSNMGTFHNGVFNDLFRVWKKFFFVFQVFMIFLEAGACYWSTASWYTPRKISPHFGNLFWKKMWRTLFAAWM